jgi:O-antigen/teichoic acid export membrane protein
VTRPGSLVRNVLSNWIGIPITVAYGLIITPIIVRALDTELYGVWSFLNGLIAYSDLLYVGLGAALVKYVAERRANDDREGMNRLFSVVFSIYFVIGIVCWGVMIAISEVVPSLFAQPLSVEAARAASLACVLLGAQLFFAFIGSAFSGLIYGYDRFDLVNFVYIASVAVRLVATPVVLQSGDDPLLRLAAFTASVAAILALTYATVAYRLVPHLSLRFVRWRLDELRVLYGFGVPSFFITFAGRIVSFSDTTIIGIMLGAPAVAIYALPVQLMEYARAPVAGFTRVFLPRLATMTTHGDLVSLREAYLSTTRIATFLQAWIAATALALGPSFLSRWVGDAFGAPAQWVLVFLALAAVFQVLSTHAPLSFYQAMHLVRFPAKVLMLEALLNLGLTIWLAPRLGITGVALATAIPALFVGALVLTPYLCRHLGVPLRTFFAVSVLPGALMFPATVAVLYLSGLVITSDSYTALALRAAFSVPVALLVFVVTFPAEERRAMRGLLRTSVAHV